MDICIIGGDLRIARLAEMYARENNNVYTYGLERCFLVDKENNNEAYSEKTKEDEYQTEHNNTSSFLVSVHSKKEYSNIVMCNDLKEAVSRSKIVISGIPFSKDGVNVYAPFAEKKIKIEELQNEINNKTFIAGSIPNNFYNNNINNIDLLKNEELTILNAIPTVEGTIKIAIEEREETIHESNVLICGFGRIGKILCKKFKALGANVYCVARKDADLAWIREGRYIPLTYGEVPEIGDTIDIVINTVPTLVLKEKELNSFRSDVLIIDVASNPGGVDKEYAEKKRIKVITALGIPGKEMPETAAKYIKEVISKSLDTIH